MPKTRLGIVLLMLLGLTTLLRADGRVVREFKTEDFPADFAANKPPGDTVSTDGVWRLKWDDRLSVEAVTGGTPDTPHTVTVLALDNPGITQTRYFMLGDVEYSNVEGKGYLELWNDFPDGGHYFSRTMGDSGPMMTLSGSSAKRPFMLPFNSNAGQVPSKLTLNVVLPGKGKVTLSRVRLVENGEPATGPAATAPTLEQRMLERRARERTQGDANAATTQAESAPGPAPLSPAGLPPEAAAEVRKQLAGELVAYLQTRRNIQSRLNVDRQQLGTGHREVKREEADLAALDRRIDSLKAALAEPTPPAAVSAAAVSAAMTPTDVKHSGDGIRAFTFNEPDATGTRQMIVRSYDRPVGGFPEHLRGQFTWHGVTGKAASIGYFYDDANGQRKGVDTRLPTSGTDGSTDFLTPIIDRDARRIFVNVVCPGPGRIEVDLPESLSPAMASLAWLDRHSAYLFAGLVAVTLLAIVPLRLLMKNGRGRAIVVGFFGLMLVAGVGQLFAAGVALGLGRPTDAWVGLLGGAAILIVVGGLMLRQARAYYAGFELRKLQAMDVA